MDGSPPETIIFRKKQYNIYGVYRKKHDAVVEAEGLHAQNIKTHTIPWNTLYHVIYTLEKKK